jgi:hypothetical protein
MTMLALASPLLGLLLLFALQRMESWLARNLDQRRKMVIAQLSAGHRPWAGYGIRGLRRHPSQSAWKRK